MSIKFGNEHTAVLRGYDSTGTEWRNWTQTGYVDLQGIIIQFNGRKYLVGPREYPMSCRRIEVFYPINIPFDDAKTVRPKRTNPGVMMQAVVPYFHLWDMCLAMYVSPGHDEFIPEVGQLISDNYRPGMVCQAFDLTSYEKNLPAKKTPYKIVSIDLITRPKTVRLENRSIDVIYNRTYIMPRPEVIGMEKNIGVVIHDLGFRKPSKFIKETHFDGCPLIDSEGLFYGMAIHQDGSIVSTIPAKLVAKLVSDCWTFRTEPELYSGLVTKPFNYEVQNALCTITEDTRIQTAKGKVRVLKKGDVLSAIDGKTIEIFQQYARVMDDELGRAIDIDMYIRLNHNVRSAFSLTVERKANNKSVTVNILPALCENRLIISAAPFYRPRSLFPFINYKGIIMVQLTYELVSMMKDCDRDLDNELINRACKGDDRDRIDLNPQVIIIDVMNHELAYDKDLPQFQYKSKRHLECPIVHTINDTPIQTLDQVPDALTSHSPDPSHTNTLACGYNMKHKPGCGTVLQV